MKIFGRYVEVRTGQQKHQEWDLIASMSLHLLASCMELTGGTSITPEQIRDIANSNFHEADVV